MFSRTTLTTLALAASLLPTSFALFAFQHGASCTYTGPGVVCPTFDDGSGTGSTISGAYCGPNGVCGDDGAVCTSNEGCYDYCGSNGICGGLNADCDSTLPSSQTSAPLAVTCYTPSYTCDTVNQLCTLSASQGAGARRNKKRSVVSCEKQGWTTCQVDQLSKAGASFECVDTMSSLEQCGGCDAATGGVDCTNIAGASSVECVAGTCVVESCEPGFTLSDGACF